MCFAQNFAEVLKQKFCIRIHSTTNTSLILVSLKILAIGMSSHNLSPATDTSSEIDSDAALRSFSEYTTESDYSSDATPEKTYINPVTELAREVLLYRAKYNVSYAAASDLSNKMNSVPGSETQIPTNKKQLKRTVILKYTYIRYIFCDFCRILYKFGDTCSLCQRDTPKRKDNYFIHIPLRQQIKHTLDRHASRIVEHLCSSKEESNQICDTFHSNIYKKCLSKTDRNILSLTLNTDGAKIFSSSKSTLWPIQLVQNYLPPNIRFLRENILLVGIYCGKTKPQMSAILIPLIEEMETLQVTGFSIWHNSQLLSLIPRILFCACDIPARVDLQYVKMFNGYYGCPCCEQKGVCVKNIKTKKSYVRFLKETEISKLRSHGEILRISETIIKEKLEFDIKGIKGLSPMIGFKDFDLSDSFVIDWMHGALLGVMKLLFDIWLGAKKLIYQDDELFQFKSLTINQRFELNRRLLALKPPIRINHKPRNILDRSYFTANEYRSHLWFYLKYALKGLLDSRLVAHFDLLSRATYMLSGTQITHSEVQVANKMLHRFSDEFEQYYGRNAVTINIHLLRHYADVVLNTGPLWCHSLFTFESNIGELKRLFCGTVDVVEQIAFNYCMKRSEIKEHHKENIRILRPKQAIVPKDIEHILLRFDQLYSKNREYKIGYELMWKNNEVIKSISSPRNKSIDYFIELRDDTVGTVNCFIEINTILYVVIEENQIMPQKNGNDHHLKQVLQKNELKIFKVDDIRRKLIYLQFKYANICSVNIISVEPNPFEGT